MEKFFSSNGKFNIYFVIGLSLIIADFFYSKYPIALIGLLIGSIPETKNAINDYKETGKLSFYLTTQGFVFITAIYIIISIMFGI